MFRQAQGGGEGVLGGFKSPVERGEGDFEVDGVVRRGGLDCVVFFEDAVLPPGFRKAVLGVKLGNRWGTHYREDSGCSVSKVLWIYKHS